MGVRFKSGVTALSGGDPSRTGDRGICHATFIDSTVQGRKIYKPDLESEKHSVRLV